MKMWSVPSMFQPVLPEQRQVLSAAFMRGAEHSQGTRSPVASWSHITGKAKHFTANREDTTPSQSRDPRGLSSQNLSFGFFNGFWGCMEGGRGQDCTGSSRHPVLLCICWQGGHGDGLKQSGRHAGGDCQAVARALEGKIWRGKKRLEDAHQAESRATLRNEIHLVFVRTVKGWNFMKLFWPGYKQTTNPVSHWILEISFLRHRHIF